MLTSSGLAPSPPYSNWKPSLIASPNQTCFFSLMFLLVYQFF
uniref:Uncharacterized protein n=1 Tax=Anguilla anguilla TaxID=7936 RepID=A0A0E9XKV6_ANGAN